MKVEILGTAAAEGWPGLFCNCRICRQVRKTKGKDIRSRSSVLIDGSVQIDGGFDNFYHSVNADFTEVRDIFITHEHSDHFCPEDLYCIFFNDISIYGNRKVIDSMKKCEYMPENFSGLKLMKPFESVITGDGHKITSVKAEHNPDVTDQLNYITEFNGKTLAYLTDTGLYKDENTWDFFRKFRFDTVISECTTGWVERDPVYHQTYEGVKVLRQRFKDMGCITDKTPFYLTHFSHNCGMLHEEMSRLAEKDGIHICYDGMSINI